MNITGTHAPHSAKPTLEKTECCIAKCWGKFVIHTSIKTKISFLGTSIQNFSTDFQKKRSI